MFRNICSRIIVLTILVFAHLFPVIAFGAVHDLVIYHTNDVHGYMFEVRDMDGARERVRSSSTNLGRIICASLVDATGADAAILNGGSARDSILSGDVTKGELLSVLPYGNYIYTIDISGSDLLDALNHGLKEKGNGAFPQFWGMEVVARPEKNGFVAESVTIGGKPLSPEGKYTLAINDFLHSGGDGYEMFKKYEYREFETLEEAFRVFVTGKDVEALKAISDAEILKVSAPGAVRPVRTLSPSKIGEFAAAYDTGDAYPFRPDPNGKYYHFEEFATGGCSVYCAIQRFEEVFSATSSREPINNIKYGPENLNNCNVDGIVGGNRENVWCEGVKGYGIGERINMSLRLKASFKGYEDRIYLDELMIVNGHAKNNTTWKNNSRVKTLRLYVGGEPWFDLQLKDTIKPQIFVFGEHDLIYPAISGKRYPEWEEDNDTIESAAYQTDFSFEIREVYKGAKYDDTCITGIAWGISAPNHHH